ncbi:glycoside hydrolase family 13 protein [candidate division KSB1 bacterium]|nr:glycoside hydrolase family 13 protein [candidate division KSB1 bacterium]
MILKKIFSIFFICFSIFIINCNCTKEQKLQTVPDWAKQAIWYQIFPERFCNGDTSNDPTMKDLEGGWPHYTPDEWQIHPWTSDWYNLQPWEKKYKKDFYWCAGLRRYGGDLQGVLDKLDYLQELGINAIYFNPLFESPSLHKYDATMYHHIDNNFGPAPEKDKEIWKKENAADPATWQWTTADKLFLKLIEECHNRGIKVIIDGVFNHVGNTFWAFIDVIENQQNSMFKDWFIIKNWDDPNTPANEFEYEGWLGVKELPEITEDENGLVSGAREHVHAIVKRWMDPNGDGDPSDGIDGWRLDVAEKVNINFWKTFRTWVRDINPDAYITGEIWWEDWENNKMFNAAPWLQGDAFDAVMNYRVAKVIKNFVIDKKGKISSQEFVDAIGQIHTDYNWDNVLVCQNLMDSHDVDRLASQIVNPDRWFDHYANPGQNPHYEVRKPTKTEMLKLQLVVAMQMTLPGAPMIYYGDEVGMWGGDDPDCRKPMVWKELHYEPEVAHPTGKFRPKDEVTFDNELFAWYEKLIRIRKENPVLSLGKIDFFLSDVKNNILGYKRNYQNETLWIIINNNNEPKSINLDSEVFAASTDKLVDLITNTDFSSLVTDNKLSLKPYQVLVLK